MAVSHSHSNYMHCSSDAFDTELLLSCMDTLKHGRPVSIPNYDFKTHKSVEPSRVVLYNASLVRIILIFKFTR